MVARKAKEGNVYLSKQGLKYTVINYSNSREVWIEFEHTGHEEDYPKTIKVQSSAVLSGKIRHPFAKTLYGRGVRGDERVRFPDGRLCPYYNRWKHMLLRCYCPKYHEKKPTYRDCTVCDEWLYFPTFKKWLKNTIRVMGVELEDVELDKDVLTKHNTVYSPDTCCLLPRELNILFTNRKSHRGKEMIGVCYHKRDKHYRASISIKGTNTLIGSFETEEEAFSAYKVAKENHINLLATENFKDGKIDAQTYQALLSFKVEPSD